MTRPAGPTPVERLADWDPYSADALADPAASWAGLREGCPVAWVELMGGFWAVSRYDDVIEIARAPNRFNNSGGPQFGTRRPPLEVDRPEHTFYRDVLQPYFARERVAQLEPGVRGFVSEMLAPLLDAGGGDLAEALTCNSILRVAADAGIQRRLRAEPGLIPSAIEEFLRLETPVQSMPRWANEDTELHGRRIAAGEQIMLFWAAANRDPELFPDPDSCLLDRSSNEHITFGRGIHRCIGMDLARLEIRVALEELLGATGWIELAGEPVRTTYIRQGVAHLPIRIRSEEGA